MHLDAWDESTKVTYDRQLWAELTSLRFLADSYDVLVMGAVDVGKTFLANALGHAAVRRRYTFHTAPSASAPRIRFSLFPMRKCSPE